MEINKPHLTSYQKDILFCDARFTITEASTKVGKTHSHIIWLFGKAHEYEQAEGKNYWWVAPVFSQSKIAFKRLRRNLSQYGVYNFNESNLVISLKESLLQYLLYYNKIIYSVIFDIFKYILLYFIKLVFLL